MMKILYILKKDPDPTIRTIMDATSQEAEVVIHDLQKSQDYNSLVERIEECDKVITW